VVQDFPLIFAPMPRAGRSGRCGCSSPSWAYRGPGYLYPEELRREAMLVQAQSALQGYAPAKEQIDFIGVPPEMPFAEGLLLLMTEDTQTAIGRAALWCGAQGDTDEAWIRACRIRSLEGHLACTLPRSVTDTLGLHGFEQSEAYSNRMNAVADARKVEPR
jgi:hypothetical protein